MPGTDKVIVPLIGAFQREVYDRLRHESRQVEWTQVKTEEADETDSVDANGSSECRLYKPFITWQFMFYLPRSDLFH